MLRSLRPAGASHQGHCRHSTMVHVMNADLMDKREIVGANKGIGRATAAEMAHLGASVASRILNLIDGELREPVSGQYFDNVDPATGQAYGLVPDSDRHDLDSAVKAARQAFPAWRDTLPEKR